MEIEIRDITPEEAAPYGGNNSAVLAGRKTVVFTDADGNSGKLYMKEEDIELLGESYIAENSTMEYSKVCEEWFRIQERPAEKSTEDHRRRVYLRHGGRMHRNLAQARHWRLPHAATLQRAVLPMADLLSASGLVGRWELHPPEYHVPTWEANREGAVRRLERNGRVQRHLQSEF